jgi:hypothetical protein
MEQSSTPQQQIIVVTKPKSTVLAFILTFLFGPLGLLYVSVVGGLVMMLAGIIAFFLLPLIGPIIIWIISMVWGVVGALHSRK